MFVMNCKMVFVKVCSAISIAEFSEAEEVVGEAGHDVYRACVRGYSRDGELSCRGGGSEFPRRCPDFCFWCSVVNVDKRRCSSEVVLARSGIRDCRISASCNRYGCLWVGCRGLW